MKRRKITYRSTMSTEITEGESIEKKIDRMVETNEPIGETAPMIYTKKTDGVIPAYDIKTDKWEIAQDAMSKISDFATIAKYPINAPKGKEPLSPIKTSAG